MMDGFGAAVRPDLYGQLAATDPYQGRARRLFERGQVVAVSGNQADVRVGYGARGNALELKQVPIMSGYVPRVGDWVSIQYEAGHAGAPWVSGPSMAANEAGDSAGVGVFSVASEEPADPQQSTIYFDEVRRTWRGWDGSTWVDFSSRLHNDLPDLQGGGAGAYYHLSGAEHGALQDLYDGDGMASAWVKRLRFKSVDATPTSRTRMIEKDGDFFWAINAEYNEAAGEWNRIDTAKYAYLIGLWSKNGIPHEPGDLGGVAWWRCLPGSNPIGEWTSMGGWELGFMMTMHRNFVAGGMNFEIDGSGSPPYGRLCQSGHEDADCFTGIVRNVWYSGNDGGAGEGYWGWDVEPTPGVYHKAFSNAILDDEGFVWRYHEAPTSSGEHFHTADWLDLARLHVDAQIGRLDVIRRSAVTNLPGSSFLAKHKTSGDMADGFGAGYLFAIEDSAGVENTIAAIYGVRAGADNTGKLSWQIANAGSLAERMSLTAAGVLSITGASMNFAGKALSVEADSAINQDLTSDSATAAFASLAVTGTGGLQASASANGLIRHGFANTSTGASRRIDVSIGTGVGGLEALYFGVDQSAGGYGAYLDNRTGQTFYYKVGGTTKVSIDASGNAAIAGNFGPLADTDLIAMTANLLTVNGTVNVTGEYQVDGLRVVTNRQAHLADPNAALGALATWAANINSLLETHGLMATS